MRWINPSAVGGIKAYLRQRQREIAQAYLDQFKMDSEMWGVFTHLASETPVDRANYDDPHKPKPRRPGVDDDLEGWEPIP